MPNENEIRALKRRLKVIVDENLSRGAPQYATTPLERHAYDMGRYHALDWVAPEPKPEPEKEVRLNGL